MSDISQININNTTYNIKDIEGRTQVEIMPTASADLLGKIYQFVGATGAFTNGYFYKCVAGETAGTYEWIPVAVQSGSGEQLVWIGTRAEHTTAEQEGTLPETAIIGITDESGGGGGGSDVIDDEHISTETTYSSSKIETMFSDLYTKSFANCSDEELVAILAAADRGEENPSNYWAVGDARTIHLSAMSAMAPLDDTHEAQDVEFVIVHQGLYKDTNDKTVNFVVQMRDCLKEKGRMNSISEKTTTWETVPRREWCNTVFYNAIPASIRSIFKQFKTLTATDSDTVETMITTNNYFTFAAIAEVVGAVPESNTTHLIPSSEKIALKQFDYYKISINMQKHGESYTKVGWWTRTQRVPRSTGNNYIWDIMGYGTNYILNPAESNAQYYMSLMGCI